MFSHNTKYCIVNIIYYIYIYFKTNKINNNFKQYLKQCLRITLLGQKGSNSF